MSRYFNRQNGPLTLLQWSALFSDDAYKRVLLTKFEDGTEISTVWLGLEHGHDEQGNPFIFETMIFSDDDQVNEYCERYTTEEEAKEGHYAICHRYSVGDWT